MPKKVDPAVKERAVRLVREHRAEYSSLTAAAAAVARQERLGTETVRRWALQAEIDAGERQGPTSGELAEIKDALTHETGSLKQLFQPGMRIVLLIGIVITGNLATKFFSVIALIFSILTFFSRLYPTIRRMDEAEQITPHGYSRTLGIMIVSFVGVFASAAVVFLVFFRPA